MKDIIVLYPALGSGHLMSMVELGKLIVTQYPSFSIIILILTPPNENTNNKDTTLSPQEHYIASASTTFPSINFHYISPISLPATLLTHFITFEISPQSNHHVDNIIQSISKTKNLKAVILDFFTYSAYQIATKLEISTYFYYTSDDYPDELDFESDEFKILLESTKTMTKNVGLIVNTFDAIEGKAVESLNKGLFVPNRTTPTYFSIGPLITSSYDGDENGCLHWLNLQPSKSVVLLSFGSMGRFSKAQLKEIAVGLEKSAISHDSIGGFVNHCGLNSVLEAVCEGVPMVAWPLYAEQSLNKVILVEEMKVVLELNKSKDGFMSGIELVDRIKELMESYKGNEI
ncbi:unnamed protein product [Vicia faba]|uniref:Uncharacterized protein n=1 Tax=Vicia faba TaxID=3906 RepID=A0AAV1B0X4_VICFA|nr:unnamed protein product [Vicia faba]